jgi:Tat protein secretion system quality control protein TatD with DNase activity
MKLLTELLVLVREARKLVVIHCRDRGSGEAARHVLDTIRMLNMEDHVFHKHCFVGTIAEATEWTGCLASVVFGISAKIFTDNTLQEVTRVLDMDHIVLETNSLYLAKGPADIIDIAEEVAKIKRVNLHDVLRANRKNAVRVYER